MHSRMFRIQDACGKGSYRNKDWPGVEEISSWDSLNRHPMPQDDSKLREENKDLFMDSWCGLVFNASRFIFGFSTIEQLRSWLYKDEWLENLFLSDFYLVELEGDVRHGNTQACIDSRTMKVIATHSIAEFFNL